MPGGAREGAGAPVGNNNAGKGARFKRELQKVFDKLDHGVEPGTAEQAILTNYVMEAMAGDKDVRKDLLDRIYGKPAQAITGGDEDDQPVKFTAMVKLVRPTD
jgi:hypothetical protein